MYVKIVCSYSNLTGFTISKEILFINSLFMFQSSMHITQILIINDFTIDQVYLKDK